jgi:S1-C subfamily serine protease
MTMTSNWALPAELQADPRKLRFDLEGAMGSVLALSAEVPEDAYTAPILGTDRAGNGVVINAEGLVLTIGYLITEASTIWLTANNGEVVQGYALAYDFATGFGLVQPLGRLSAPALPRGDAAPVTIGERVVVISHGGRAHALQAKISAKREFAGYWEYLLDEALFTTPAHPDWSGAALLGADGRLLGIGSLLVQEAADQQTEQGNMFVPVNLLEPILEQLLATGSAQRASRPWLGIYTAETNGHLIVSGLAPGAPAEQGGVHPGDLLLEINGERVAKLGDFLRKLWRGTQPGAEVLLTLGRDGDLLNLRLRCANRNDYLKKPLLH